MNVLSPLHKSSVLRPFSPSVSPLSVEKSLLKQIESPLVCGWMCFCVNVCGCVDMGCFHVSMHVWVDGYVSLQCTNLFL